MSRAIARWGAIAGTALAALAAGWYFGMRDAPQSPSALLQLALPDVDGREQRLDQWKGKVLVVNFWATWCEPCREEMPEFVKAQAALGSKGLQFVGIGIDQPSKIRQFGQDLKINYPSLVGGYGALDLSETLGNKIKALPFTLIIGRNFSACWSAS